MNPTIVVAVSFRLPSRSAVSRTAGTTIAAVSPAATRIFDRAIRQRGDRLDDQVDGGPVVDLRADGRRPDDQRDERHDRPDDERVEDPIGSRAARR